MAAITMMVIIMGTVMGVVLLGTAVNAQEGTAVSGVTPLLLQYQGRLSDPSSGEEVVDGSYTMVFRLYKGPSGGSPLWTEAKDVPTQGGLFSTVLGDVTPLSQDLFNGQALWLGIKVGSDAEATPRQQVLPVAYALSLVPGAVIQGSSSSPVLRVNNSGSGRALETSGPVVVHGNLTVDGNLSGGSHTHSSHNNNANAHHTRYTDAEAASAWLNHPESVTQYEFQDHVFGGGHHSHDMSIVASGAIYGNGSIASSSGNVSSRWRSDWEDYEISISGHYYEWKSYVTVVTPIIGTANAWSVSGSGKLYVGIYNTQGNAMQSDFHFVVYQ